MFEHGQLLVINHYSHTSSYKYRETPVPCINSHRYRRLFRCPRTTQERRFNEYHSIFVRGRRSTRNLPTAFDDLSNKSLCIRTWKRTKKTKQYL